MIHSLKCERDYFESVINFSKKAEVRLNDRNYKVGDFLALNELKEDGIGFTGRSVLLWVRHILDDNRFCKEGFVIMSFEPVRVNTNEPCEMPKFILEGEER